MIKWLSISLTVLLVFSLILLGLGYLLQQNEKTTTALKQQLEQQRLAEIKKNLQVNSYPEVKISLNNIDIKQIIVDDKENSFLQPDSPNSSEILQTPQQIIEENLICVANEQCVLATIGTKNKHCYVVVNSIGAAKLKKLDYPEIGSTQCQKDSGQVSVKCLSNLCSMTIKPIDY
jgi:hypothetical protein